MNGFIDRRKVPFFHVFFRQIDEALRNLQRSLRELSQNDETDPWPLLSLKPDRKFRQYYQELFMEDPVRANLMLLLNELADENGYVTVIDNEELVILMRMRFGDPWRWGL